MGNTRIGHIGVGDIAVIRYFPCYKKGGITLSAVSTRSSGKQSLAKAEFPNAEIYADYREMLKKAPIDAVVVTTPTPSHFQIVMDCLRAGKHVFVEKPLTLSLTETDSMIEAAQKKKLKFMVLPYDEVASLKETRRILKEGTIGTILSAEATMAGNGVFHTDWFYQAGSGELNDFAIYAISWLVGFFGPAESVVAFGSTRVPERTLADGRVVKNEVEDTSAIMLRWQSGVLGTIATNWQTSGLGQFFKNGIWRGNAVYHTSIYGTDGLIHCDYGLNGVTLIAHGKTSESERTSDYETLKGVRKEWGSSELSAETWGGIEMVRDFVNAIEDDTEVPTHLGQVRHVIEIVGKAYESIKTGKVQKLGTKF
jgi:predicted dehydrogenase